MLPFISMIDRRRTVHRTVAAELAATWPQLLATPIPSVAAVERMGTERGAARGVRALDPWCRRLPGAVGRDRDPAVDVTARRSSPVRRVVVRPCLRSAPCG